MAEKPRLAVRVVGKKAGEVADYETDKFDDGTRENVGLMDALSAFFEAHPNIRQIEVANVADE